MRSAALQSSRGYARQSGNGFVALPIARGRCGAANALFKGECTKIGREAHAFCTVGASRMLRALRLRVTVAGNCLCGVVVEAVSVPFSFGGMGGGSPVASCATPLLEAPAAAALCEVRTLRRFGLVSRGSYARFGHILQLAASTQIENRQH